MPPEFRNIITNALTTVANHSVETDIGRRASLALAICHIEHFHVGHNLRQAAEWVTKAAQRGDVMAQGLLARVYDAAGIPVPQDLPWKSWVVNAMKHGSFTAKRILGEIDKTLHDETVKADLETRRLRDLAHRRIIEAYITQSSASPQEIVANKEAHPLPPSLLELDIFSSPNTSLLHCASYLGDVELCRTLLETDTLPIDVANQDGETALHYACRNNMEDVIQFLLSNGANPKVQSSEGVTPLHHATISAFFRPNVIRLLVDHGADVNAQSSIGYAGIKGLPVLDHGCSIAGSPLHWAVKKGDVSVVIRLLQHGANPNLSNVQGISPLQLAIGHREFEILDLLLRHSATDEIPSDDLLLPWIGWKYAFPLTRNIHIYKRLESSLSVVEYLSRYGVTIDQRKILLQTLDNDDVALADHIIRQLNLGPDTDLGLVWHEGGDRPVRLDFLLYIAVFNCSPAMVKMIIQHFGGTIPRDLVVEGQTLLGTLSIRTSLTDEEIGDIAAMLLSAGADVDVKDVFSKTPLYSAVQWSRVELVRVLLDTKYTHLPSDLHGPLWLCLRRTSSKVAVPILNLFLKAKPDLLLFPTNLSTSKSNFLHAICDTPETSRDDAINEHVLQVVVSHMRTLPGGLERLRACIDHKTPPHQRTALHAAALWGNWRAARLLLDLGADVNAHGDNFNFQTPLDVAEQRDWGKHQSLMLRDPELDRSALGGGLETEMINFEKDTKALIKLFKERGGKNGSLYFSSLTSVDFSLDSLIGGLGLPLNIST